MIRGIRAPSLAPKIRELLRQNSDGLTASEIVVALSAKHKTHINHVLRQMPDTYIDRWMPTGYSPAAVWCVVEVPENCPKPRAWLK